MISNVLDSLKTSKLEVLKFHASYWDNLVDYLLRRAVKFAVLRNTEKVDLSLSEFGVEWDCLELPSSLCNCQSLKVLKIQASDSFCELPRSFDWPSLTTLSLKQVDTLQLPS